jgi:hypothetical protein
MPRLALALWAVSATAVFDPSAERRAVELARVHQELAKVERRPDHAHRPPPAARTAPFAEALRMRCDLRVFQTRHNFTRLCVAAGRAERGADVYALLRSARQGCRAAYSPAQAEAPVALVFASPLLRKNNSCFLPALRAAPLNRAQSLQSLVRLSQFYTTRYPNRAPPHRRKPDFSLGLSTRPPAGAPERRAL